MPMSPDFAARLARHLPTLLNHGLHTPFHVYDEKGIRETGALLKSVMPEGFQEFFAVKALPDPAILRIMHDMGFGFDCSSELELMLARQAGAKPNDIFFTSNNTTYHEFEVAFQHGGAIINLDDISFLKKQPMRSGMPNLICFRINPGDRQTGNSIIGNPVTAKYGITWDQIIPAYKEARDLGAERFGIHTMVASNDRDHEHMLITLDLLLQEAAVLQAQIGIEVEFINIGGGIGIPYRRDDLPFDFQRFGDGCKERLTNFWTCYGFKPKLFMENGRCMTGPHGVLVNRAINRMEKYRTFIGVQCAMPALMRPAIYSTAHHDITVMDQHCRWVTSEERGEETVSVVGPICEDCDRLATDRVLPKIHADENKGDFIITHDTGAHGAAMGFNYNGRTRVAAYLLCTDGSFVQTRRHENVFDLLSRTHQL